MGHGSKRCPKPPKEEDADAGGFDAAASGFDVSGGAGDGFDAPASGFDNNGFDTGVTVGGGDGGW